MLVPQLASEPHPREISMEMLPVRLPPGADLRLALEACCASTSPAPRMFYRASAA